ncbi:Hypp5074 [Branchiostoma lanceolatum]|uniref:Hypp5074 protein n=1 Tax=Branchiostoma lanceolatum TaxID=7740 RepID=A0A8K0AE49_BRALA|nr:Hypp5074 [Branchiostoma lanceolatum]
MGSVGGCMCPKTVVRPFSPEEESYYDTRKLLSELITVQTAIVFTESAPPSPIDPGADSLMYRLRSILEVSRKEEKPGATPQRLNLKEMDGLPGIVETSDTEGRSLSCRSSFSRHIQSRHSDVSQATISVISSTRIENVNRQPRS